MPVLLGRMADTSGQHEEWAFWCPGCKCNHSYVTKLPAHSAGPIWSWNGSKEKPTFSPSLLCTWERWEPAVNAENMAEFDRAPWRQERVTKRCHVFLTDGKIQFLGDCTHALKGQTVEMVDFDGMGK